MIRWTVRVLGEITVARDGATVPLARGARDLVVALALLGPEPVKLDRIIDAMHPDVDGEPLLRARVATTRALARLRAQCPDLVDLDNGTYALAADVDLERYRATEVFAAYWRDGLETLRAMVAAYGGDLGGDHAPAWAGKAREKLRKSYLQCLADLADRRAADGDHQEAAGLARTLTMLEPVHPSYVRMLMEALADLGDEDGIQAAYRLHNDYRRAMGQDGVDPEVDAVRRRQLARVAKARTSAASVA